MHACIKEEEKEKVKEREEETAIKTSSKRAQLKWTRNFEREI
jgi:hypothetical protein